MKTDTCLSAFIALLMSAVLTAPVHAAADGKESSQVWRARLVKCDPSSTGVQESAGLVGLGAVLLERGFAVAAGAIRKGIAAAGKDKSVSFIADHPAYLVRMDANRMRHDLRCVVIARGTPLAPFETASNPPTIDNANQAVQASVRNGLAALGLSGVPFYANVAFKPSDDGAATRAVVTQLYYPRRLFAGRGSAVRTLNVTAVVTAPGQDKSMLAASLTFEDLATRAALVHDDNGLEAKSSVGWFVTPKVELSESQKRRSGFAYPVNLSTTVTETAAGNAFFKALDAYLDDATWKAATEAVKQELLPASRDAARDAAQADYQKAIAAYFPAMDTLAAACTVFATAPTASNRGKAWAAYFAAASAYRTLEDARTQGMPAPSPETTPAPVTCPGLAG